jgi:GntR family transcriptional regulator
MPDEGGPVPAKSRFLECRRQRATADVARALDLKAGDSVVFVRRVLSFDNRPIVVDDIWLPGSLFKGLTADRLDQYHGPLYGLFESEFGTRMIRADERLRACPAEPDVARLLKIAPGAPVLLVERVSMTYGERPVELRRGFCLTEHHHYHNVLT